MYIIIPPLRLKLLYSESNKDDNHRRRSIHAVVHVSKVRRDDIPAVERVPIAGRHGGLLAHRRDRQVTGLRVLRQHRELFNLADQFPFLPSFPSFLPSVLRSLLGPWEQLRLTAISSRNLYRISGPGFDQSPRPARIPTPFEWIVALSPRSGPIAIPILLSLSLSLPRPHPRSVIRKWLPSGDLSSKYTRIFAFRTCIFVSFLKIGRLNYRIRVWNVYICVWTFSCIFISFLKIGRLNYRIRVWYIYMYDSRW